MDNIAFRPIGVIRTPFNEQAGTPIQSSLARDAEGEVEVFDHYTEGLKDLDAFERIWIVYVFHRSRSWEPLVVPYLDKVSRGLFATRAPARPCPIGLSVVRLRSVVGNRLKVRGVDVLDGTPLLDIKPYVPRFDAYPESRAGWLDGVVEPRRDADGRFEGE